MSHSASQPCWSPLRIGLVVGKTAKARGTLRAIQQLVAFALVRCIDGIIVEACKAVTCSPNVELCSVCCRYHPGDPSSGHIPGIILEPRPAGGAHA